MPLVFLESEGRIDIFQDGVEDIQLEGDRVSAVVTRSGILFHASAIVPTAGTFLHGRMRGRGKPVWWQHGDQAALGLADRLREICLRVGRLKTGTPPGSMPVLSISLSWLSSGERAQTRNVANGKSRRHPEQMLLGHGNQHANPRDYP